MENVVFNLLQCAELQNKNGTGSKQEENERVIERVNKKLYSNSYHRGKCNLFGFFPFQPVLSLGGIS
jgi:hypothetical protein